MRGTEIPRGCEKFQGECFDCPLPDCEWVIPNDKTKHEKEVSKIVEQEAKYRLKRNGLIKQEFEKHGNTRKISVKHNLNRRTVTRILKKIKR